MHGFVFTRFSPGENYPWKRKEEEKENEAMRGVGPLFIPQDYKSCLCNGICVVKYLYVKKLFIT